MLISIEAGMVLVKIAYYIVHVAYSSFSFFLFLAQGLPGTSFFFTPSVYNNAVIIEW